VLFNCLSYGSVSTAIYPNTQIGWLAKEAFILSQFWRLEEQDASRVLEGYFLFF
jgi:hypothetical protein